jgi:hypothetical protein
MTQPAPSLVQVPSDCDPSAAGAVLASLRDSVAAATAEQPLALELTQGRPTAIALQLVASAAVSLRRKSAFGGYGAHATPHFDDDKGR